LALNQSRELSGESRVIISSVEHESVFKAAANATIIDVDKNGLLKIEELEKKLSMVNGQCSLVSIILANNETGVIQDIKSIAALAHKYGALIHIDAVQAFGKIPLNFADMGVDMMTISAHKIGGAVGAAALVHKKDLELKPLMFGGGQEHNKRPGTENIVGIVGFAASCEVFTSPSPSYEEANLRDYLEAEILKVAPDTIIHGSGAKRLPNTTNISMPNLQAATQLIHFDSKGICVSSGSACSSGKVEESRVLKAMDVPLRKNAIRISLGWGTTKAEIDVFVKEWKELYERRE